VRLQSPRGGLRSEAEVGKRALTVQVPDDLRRVACADLDAARSLLPELDSALLATPAGPVNAGLSSVRRNSSERETTTIRPLMEYTARIHHEGGAYLAEVPDPPGALTSGDTLDELLEGFQQACLQSSEHQQQGVMSIPIHRTRSVALPLLLLLASFAASGCGSSSNGSSSSASAGATAATSTVRTPTATTSATPDEQASGRLAALTECLHKEGIPLPQSRVGAQSGTSGLFSGGRAIQLPAGVTPARYQAALKKCGAPNILSGTGRADGRASRGELLKNPAFTRALTAFAACMRERGVKLPPPSTSGGSVFNTKGLDTKSPQFSAALSKCRSGLAAAFRLGGSASLGAR
jgi:predicted RNase H-like HicB family nuclease